MKRKKTTTPKKSSSKTTSDSPPKKKEKSSLIQAKVLSEKQFGTVKVYNEKIMEQDKETLASIFTFLANNLETKISLKLAISSAYLIIEELYHKSKEEDENQKVEQGDEFHIFKRIKKGFGLIGKGTLISKTESSVILDNVESFLEFAKLDPKQNEFSLLLVRKSKSKMQKAIQRPTFVSSKSTTIREDSSRATLLAIPNFVAHYKEMAEENHLIKQKLQEYERAAKAFNQAIKLMVECIDNYPSVFNIQETTITVGDESITYGHNQRAKLNTLNETQKIHYIADNILKKPLTELNESEIELVLKIIMDIRGLNVNTDKEELRKLRNIFRAAKCNSKK